MRTPKGIFFADGIRFKDIDFEDPDSTAEAISARFNGWYIDSIKILLGQGKVFSAGLISISFIDALSEYVTQSDKHERFIAWCESNLPDFSEDDPLKPVHNFFSKHY